MKNKPDINSLIALALCARDLRKVQRRLNDGDGSGPGLEMGEAYDLIDQEENLTDRLDLHIQECLSCLDRSDE